jgi:SMODS and SLOG-associating 2TM effector domain 1/SMODS and SLOG-associating 2TM effector domain 3
VLEDGTVPYRLWIGVTGHRDLADDPTVRDRVTMVLDRVQELAAAPEATPVVLGVVSPLAEGADRLVARAVLSRPGTAMEVALPLHLPDYLNDFATPASRREFDDLLGQASMVTVLPATMTREQAYLQVGHYLVDRCDVLLAIWDGKQARGQGGTGEIVEWAREQGVPLFWIQPGEGNGVREELGDGIRSGELKELDDYNRVQVPASVISEAVEQETARWLRAGCAAGVNELFITRLTRWAVPGYARADMLSQRYQRRFLRLGRVVFFSAALAVAVGSAPSLFDAERDLWQPSAVETLLMLALLALLFYGRRRRLHARWISYRSLAEQCRMASFLAAAGVGASRTLNPDRVELDNPRRDWVWRAFEEIWITRPRASVADPDLAALKRFLCDTWLEHQRDYHSRTSERHHRRDRVISRAVVLLFAATLIAAVVHAITRARGDWGASLTFLTIVLPALAAAMGGIREQREYQRSAERSRDMARDLEAAKQRMASAPDRSAVQAVAARTAVAVLGENRDWFGTMRFHEIELPT